jgi:SAM-dependent methyltransferase
MKNPKQSENIHKYDNKIIYIYINPEKPDAKFVKPYKTYCSFHDKNCTHYNCDFVADALSRHFNLPDLKIKLAKNFFEMPYFEQERLRISIDMIDKLQGKILDIGCGSAKYHFLFNNFEEVYGIDADYKAIEIARKRNPKRKYYVCDASKLPFEDNFFDVITCFEVIEHLPKEKFGELLSEIKRCLKKSGIFILSTPNKFYLERFIPKKGKDFDLAHLHIYSIFELKSELDKFGFKVQKITGINFFIPFLRKLVGEEKAVKIKNRFAKIFPIFAGTIIIKAELKWP